MFAMKLELLVEDLNDYPTLGDLKDIYHVSVTEKAFSSRKTLFSEKFIAFLNLSMVRFCKIDKVKEIALSKNFIDNLKKKKKMNNRVHIHHFHITSEVIGYSHSSCYVKVRENYHKITAVRCT